MKALYRNLPGVKRLCEKKTAKYQRICIIGNSDVGNSTLTLELGALFQLPVLHIDRLYWQPGRVKMFICQSCAKRLPKKSGLLTAIIKVHRQTVWSGVIV
ncbi:MAG: hypothetical protein DBX42_01340 [Azospirillum sp.]|nr:MAG: hypothetical protein DBX42_01340 [Azospirillum sp.]